MRKMKKTGILLLALLICLVMAGCGSSDGSGNSGGSGDSGTTGSAKEKKEPKEDTWGAVNGLSGIVEYTYDDDGNVTEMVLYNGVTGNVYRRITYTYLEPTDYGSECRTETYGANGILLYALNETRNADGYLEYSSGYDNFRGEQSSMHIYTGGEAEQVESGQENNDYDKSDYYWVQKYNDDGNISERTYYFKDAYPGAQETYDYDVDEAEYKMTYKIGGVTYGIYIPEFDDDGNLIQYVSRSDEEVAYTYEYDEEGRIRRSVEYLRGEEYAWQELTYDAEGNVEQCLFHNNDRDYTFYHENGNLVRRDGIMASIGSGDIGYMDYEYYDSGVVKALICYSHSHEEEDLEYIYSFYETGELRCETVYDYTYNSDDGRQPRSGSSFRDKRIDTFYLEDGTRVVSVETTEETDAAEGKREIKHYSEAGTWSGSDYLEFHSEVPGENEIQDIEELAESLLAGE